MDRFNLPEREGHCAYGKFFARKAGFVSREWLPDLANCRRSRPLAPNEDATALDDVVLQTILAEGTATVRELRRMLGFAENARRPTRRRKSRKRGKSRSTRF